MQIEKHERQKDWTFVVCDMIVLFEDDRLRKARNHRTPSSPSIDHCATNDTKRLVSFETEANARPNSIWLTRLAANAATPFSNNPEKKQDDKR
jgi:hypothetical protein